MYAETTTVPVLKTRMEIEKLLERHKTTQHVVATDNEGHTVTVQFKMQNRIVKFIIELPDPLADPFQDNSKKFEQAQRQRWRALLLVLKAKLEAVENKISTFESEFLSHIVVTGDGQTLGDIMPKYIERAYSDGAPSGQFLLGDGR